MAGSREQMEYEAVTEKLFSTFGSVMSREAISSIVESCSGDIYHAANAIITVANESARESEQTSTQLCQNPYNNNSNNVQSRRPVTKKNFDTHVATPIPTVYGVNQTQADVPMTYAGVSATKQVDTSQKETTKLYQNIPRRYRFDPNIWTKQIRRIVTYHNQGARILILMRGAPGCGKTYLAQKIQETTVGSTPEHIHVYSTDDYFTSSKGYKYNKGNISEAHIWNQSRVRTALCDGLSPVIVDNTNIEIWELYSYAVDGVSNGYIFELVEPKTPWARNLNELVRRNVHGVPKETIKKKLNSLMKTSIKSDDVISSLGLRYPLIMKPPVLRNWPKIPPPPPSNTSNATEVTQIQNCQTDMSYQGVAYEGKDSSVMDNVMQQTHVRQKDSDKISKEDGSESCVSMETHSEENDWQTCDGSNTQNTWNNWNETKQMNARKNCPAEKTDVLNNEYQNLSSMSTANTSNYISTETYNAKKVSERIIKEDTSEHNVFQDTYSAQNDLLSCNESNTQNISQGFETNNQNEVKQVNEDIFIVANKTGVLNNECQNFSSLPKPENQVELNINTEKDQQTCSTEEFCNDQNHNTTITPMESIDNITMIECNSGEHIQLSEKEDDFKKSLEEFEKVESAWDNGEAWETETKDSQNKTELNKSMDAKPPRQRKSQQKEGSLECFNSINDWKNINMYMPPWTDNNISPTSKNPVEMKSIETNTEKTNFETPTALSIVDTESKDTNLNYISNLNCKENNTENRMFDKSSMTNESTLSTAGGVHRCKNKEKHFNRFRNMFKHLNRDDLKDIFDYCRGDADWAVDIILDDMANKNTENVVCEKQSDTEDENEEPCECMASHNTIPDTMPTTTTSSSDMCNSDAASNEFSNIAKKQKKETSLSDSSQVLKRQIEQNIVISDQYYSPHCLKIRNQRRGVFEGDINVTENIESNNILSITSATNSTEIVEFNSNYEELDTPNILDIAENESDSDDESILNEVEKTLNIDLGPVFLKQLDEIFGRKDMVYTENIEPRVNMPISLLNEINALWMESLMYQLEAQSKVHEEMIKRDEEFARSLAMKQEEICQITEEPKVPDFKELMDMELALSLYQKDCEKWQKDKPTDLASKLSVQKLYDLFPDISHADLDEIHMAHHYDFKTTVAVLLMSSGRNDVVEEENGVDKFIMAEELKRQGRALAQEKERLSKEMEWPALPSQVDLSTVDHYRNEALTHLKMQALSYVNACHFMNRGMKDCANHCTDIAQFHRLKCEQAHNVAAAALMQFHKKKSQDDVTIDLHYLRVAEAKEVLDIFLDNHIRRLKESNSGKRGFTVYFITGRGLHSRGGPKIKPAVKRWLRERGLNCSERNPGLLTSKICADDKMSCELT